MSNLLLVVKTESDLGALGELLDAEKVDLVVRANLVVVGRVDKVEREHTLLLQVGLVLQGVKR
jgi:hypothetical protein